MTDREKIIEVMAENLWQADAIRATGRARREPWNDLCTTAQAKWHYSADKALTALEAAGYVVVPREPTEEMRAKGGIIIFAGDHDLDDFGAGAAADTYRTMIAAASQEPRE